MAKMDQRVVVTKQMLKNALVRLLKETHISKISVRELCEEAGINRSTFYAHYNTPQDILEELEEEKLDNIEKQLMKHDFYNNMKFNRSILTEILYAVKEDRDIFSILISDNSNKIFIRDIREVVKEISEIYETDYDEETLSYLSEFYIAGESAILAKWLDSGAVIPPDKVAKLVIQLTYNGPSQFSSEWKE